MDVVTALSHPTVGLYANVMRYVVNMASMNEQLPANFCSYKSDSHPCAPDQFYQGSLRMYSFFTYQWHCALKTKTFRQSDIWYQLFADPGSNGFYLLPGLPKVVVR